MLLASLTASAQLSDSNGGPACGYNKVFVSYAYTNLHQKHAHLDEIGMLGAEVGYAHGFGLSKEMPLYVEVGANLRYNVGDQECTTYYTTPFTEKMKAQILSLVVPVNFTYEFAIPNSNVSIAPYVGVHARYNLMAKSKYENSIDECEGWQNKFDKDVNDANHFQFGYQVGVNVNIKSFYVGIGYNQDLTRLYKDDYTNQAVHSSVLADHGNLKGTTAGATITFGMKF